MTKMSVRLAIPMFMVLFLSTPPAWSYGSGGGGGASCAEARFYSESPARNSVSASLSAISLVASDNTDLATLQITVNGRLMTPEIVRRRSGEWDLKIHLPEPINQPGRVRIAITAKSKEGCSTFFPYYLQIGQ